MHDYVYEITLLGSDEARTNVDYANSIYTDYVREIDEDKRIKAIEYFKNDRWKSKLFKVTDEFGVFEYTGDTETLLDAWYELLQKRLGEIIKAKTTDMYWLTRVIERPFEDFSLYVLPDWNNLEAYPVNSLYEWAQHLKPGDKVHIRQVFDYHI